MNWTAVGAIGELLSAAGVVATLLFLTLQLRGFSQQLRVQNERARAAERQNMLDMQSRPHVLPLLEKIYGHDETTLTRQEESLAEAYVASGIVSLVADYRLYEAGIIDEGQWQESLKLLAAYVSAEWPYAYWKRLPWRDTALDDAVDRARGQLMESEYISKLRSRAAADGV